MLNKSIAKIADKILNQDEDAISYEDACKVALFPEEDTLELMYYANKIRKKFKKELVICSIINAKSGFCTEDCAFCAQSSYHKTKINTYPLLDKNEIVDHALKMHEAGATRFSMVTSGHKVNDEEVKVLSDAAATILKKTNFTVCASLGAISASSAELLLNSGVNCYHHNLETARSYFDNVCTTHLYEEDIQTVKDAKASGMKVCSGGILGLGETWLQRVELAFTIRELDVDGVPINFLNPIQGTKMEKMPLMSPVEALKSISLFRFINPTKDIIICGGREVTLKDYQSWIFAAGANGFMIGNYLTTMGRNINMDMEMVKDGQAWLL